MLNTLKTSFKIELYCAINSFIYLLRHTPILKNITTDTLYKQENLKRRIGYFAILKDLFQKIVAKLFYLTVIYGILSFLFPAVSFLLFLHTFFFFSVIGSLINYKILSIGKRKYYAVILMGLDAKEYVVSHFLFHIILEFFLSLFGLSLFFIGIWKMSFLIAFMVAILVIFLKIIGEAFHLLFYQKTKTLLVSRSYIYWGILLLGFFCSIGLPLFHIILPKEVYIFLVFLLFFPAAFSFFYIVGLEDYKSIYKSVHTQLAVLNTNNRTAYQKQMMIDMRKKDYQIDPRKLVGKSGYDYFNTIFFLRHKVILSSSANMICLISFLAFFLLILVILIKPSYQKEIYSFFTNYFAWIILLMYFLNRGAIITQAMFHNCDRSMLTFPFYRRDKVVLNVFFQRLKTIVKVNLRPAFFIGLGYVFVLSICNGAFLPSYIFVLLSILSLSVFFSVHYLVIYYLLQPYNVQSEMKSVAFSVVSFLTYLACYLCKDIDLPYVDFALLILGVTVSYILLSLYVIYKKAPHRFRLK